MSSKKIFTLIRGGDITPAPQRKVIAAEAFSEMLSAEEMLTKVKEDAAHYREETVEECEKIKEQAAKEGFEEGFKQWAEYVAQLEKEIENVRGDMQKFILPVALKAAKKIVGREMELSEDVIVDIIKSNLKAVATHNRITIYVNREDLAAVEKKKQQLKDMLEHLEALAILERSDVEKGGCVIETEGGIINAQLENQWSILEQAFQGLMKSS